MKKNLLIFDLGSEEVKVFNKVSKVLQSDSRLSLISFYLFNLTVVIQKELFRQISFLFCFQLAQDWSKKKFCSVISGLYLLDLCFCFSCVLKVGLLIECKWLFKFFSFMRVSTSFNWLYLTCFVVSKSMPSDPLRNSHVLLALFINVGLRLYFSVYNIVFDWGIEFTKESFFVSKYWILQ